MSQTWAIPLAASANVKNSRIDFNDALQNLKSTSSGAASPTNGGQPYPNQLWVNTTTLQLFCRNRLNTTDRLLGALNPYLDHVARDGSNVMTGNLDVGANRVANLDTPEGAGDGANLLYVKRAMGIEVGSYSGNGVSGRIIELTEPEINPALIIITENATSASTVVTHYWAKGMRDGTSGEADGGHITDGTRIRSVARGAFTLGAHADVNGLTRGYSYIVFGMEGL